MNWAIVHFFFLLGMLLAGIASAQTQTLQPAWNMVGNDAGASIDATAVFGTETNPSAISKSVISVWSWNNKLKRWNFFAPGMTPQEMAAYADSRGYGVLATIAKGEGFWVNAQDTFVYDPGVVYFRMRMRGGSTTEEFRIATSSTAVIAKARSQLALPESQRSLFAIGAIAAGSGGFNTGWSWHLKDPTLEELAIELCDGKPSAVEADLVYWLNSVKSFCPWSSYVYAEGN